MGELNDGETLVELEGKYCAWKRDRPLLVNGVGEEEALLLPCCTEIEALEQLLSSQSIRWDEIKVIYDQYEFLSQVHKWRPMATVALDPCFVDGRLQYHAVRIVKKRPGRER